MLELTYQMPFERLTRLSRSMARRAFPRMWLARWGIVLAYFAILIGLLVFIDPVIAWLAGIGIGSADAPLGFFVFLGLTLLAFAIAMRLLRRSARQALRDRVDYDQAVRLTQHEHGIRIGTDTIEYDVKYPGISQLLIEPDGVVISHGILFWLIPDTAFPSPEARLAFIRDVYSRLNDRARALSEPHVRPLLGGAAV